MIEKTITKEEYCKSFIPFGAFILVERDKLPEKTQSGLYLPSEARDSNVKFAMTGVVVGKSLFEQHESAIDEYMMSVIEIGDVVGFSATTPILSPLPPGYSFEDENQFHVMHVGDIIGIYTDDESVRKRF